MKTKNHPKAKIIFWVAMAGLLIIGSAIDMFVPSLPAMTISLGTSSHSIRLMVALYLISYAVFQVIAGPLSDAFGRKWLLSLSLLGFTLATVAIPLSSDVNTLLFLRVFQGLFTAGIGVVSRSLIPDAFEGDDRKKHAAYLTFAWASGPILSPFVGAYLQHTFNWHASFYMMALYSFCLLIIVITALPETYRQHQSIQPKNIAYNYWSLLRSRFFLVSVSICGTGYACVTIFNAAGPFLIEHQLHYSVITFGHIALLMGFCWFLGGTIYRAVIGKPEEKNISNLAPWVFIASTIILLIISLTAPLRLYSMMSPICLLFISGGYLFTEHFAALLSHFPEKAGIVSAAMGTSYSAMAGVAAAIGSMISTQALAPLALTFSMLGLLMLILHHLRR